ncbi:Uncharacterised protein [Burkholderia pseudomallei]|nr:Uncharacterised protein [Burkholderia pseudomallei]CAJ2813501.1 Uncharacterised protein [Burkholderia pseudomallei]CAJ2820277.1 Uncharacterised protein [Burkholderia pseudomallei]CAJ2830406.1 Uncharacterised protein [Burkholderia pseudomallei]CAJ2900287.1 Uncharacterised protein [Burkholderia pseudomallei]
MSRRTLRRRGQSFSPSLLLLAGRAISDKPSSDFSCCRIGSVIYGNSPLRNLSRSTKLAMATLPYDPLENDNYLGRAAIVIDNLQSLSRMISNSHDQSVSPAFVARWEQILYNIKQFYLVAATRRVGANFEQDIGAVVVSNDDPELDDPIEIVRQLLPPDDRSMSRDEIERIPLAPMLVAATYCYRARQAVREGDHEQGWIYLVDAGYWCALARAGGSIRQAMHQAVDEVKGQVSGKGVEKRAKSKLPIIEYAQELAREMRPAGGWTSRNHAIQTILSRVNKFVEERNRTEKRKQAPYSERQAETTMGKWFSDMPDATELFPQTQSKKKRG